MQNNLKCIDLPVDDNNYLVIVKMQSSSHSSLESLKNIHISPFRPGKLVREISSSAKLGSSSFPHPVKVKMNTVLIKIVIVWEVWGVQKRECRYRSILGIQCMTSD